MGTFGDRLRELRNSKELTQVQLAEMAGIDRQTIGRWEKSQTAPKSENLSTLASVLGTTVDFLLTGNQGIPDRQERLNGAECNNCMSLIKDTIYVPVLSDMHQICAGEGFLLSPVDLESVEVCPVDRNEVDGPFGPKQLFVVRVEGDSMEPLIKDGARVLANPNLEVRNGDVAVVCLQARWFLKGVKFRPDGSILLRSANPDYRDIEVTKDEIDAGWVFFAGRVTNRVNFDKIQGFF